MESPAVKKAPSLLEMHFQEQQQLLAKAKQDKIHAQQQQQQQQQRSQMAHSPASPPQHCCTTPTTSTSTLATSISTTSSAETKMSSHTQLEPTPEQQQQQPQKKQKLHHTESTSPPPPPPENPFLLNQSGLLDAATSADPKYIQLVSRMAAFYQQRCQAILNYQQQRCQTWANSHRQKCQEMMQAAMLVVAWYIRDRIGRRRRRNKRAFRRGLREKSQISRRDRAGAGASGFPTRGEAVRKWVMDIPEAALPDDGSRSEGRLDVEERSFDVEREVLPDKDTQLFTVADQMIKSQLAKIDVPLLGALNLDDSDSDSDSEDGDGGMRYHGQQEEEEEEEEEDCDMEEDEDEYEDDEEEYEDYDDDDLDEESEVLVGDLASKEAEHGTGKGSLKRKRSESTSGLE